MQGGGSMFGFTHHAASHIPWDRLAQTAQDPSQFLACMLPSEGRATSAQTLPSRSEQQKRKIGKKKKTQQQQQQQTTPFGEATHSKNCLCCF